MNWFRIRLKDSGERGVTYTGSSLETFEALAEKAARGEFIRLDNLLYQDRGEIKEWAEWDNREVPSVFICGASVLAIHSFKGDPRTLSR